METSSISTIKSKKIPTLVKGKSKALEKQTVINEEKIETLIQGQTLDKLCIKNGKLENEPIIIALLIKENKMKYECAAPSCNVIMNWKKKPIELILVRKNGKPKDLRIENIELQCPNCFVQSYGCSLLKEIMVPKMIVCRICGYDKVGFLGEPYRSSKYCSVCFKKLQEGQQTINSQVKSEMLLYKSIEEATTGVKTNLTPENETKILDGLTELTHTNTSIDMNEIAIMLDSSFNSSSSFTGKTKSYNKPKSKQLINTTNSNIKISSIHDINMSSLDEEFEAISKS